MHRAVLPDLQAGQVKAERLHLPDQLLQFTERQPGGTGRRQRLLDQQQVVAEVRGAAVGQVGVPQPGRGQPPGQVEQERPVGLARRPGGQLGQQLGMRRLGRLQGQAERLAGRRRVGVHGERAADPGGRVLQRAQHMLSLDDRGLPGHLGGDERVAVPVRADPAAEPEERRARRALLPRLVQRPVHPRRHLEQRLVERGHHGAHLVDGRHGPGAQRRGAPQQVDLLAQPAPDVRLLGRAVPGIVQVGEQVGDPAQRGGHRPAARLGGVRGEYRVHPEPAEQVIELVRALVPAQLADRGGQRLADRGVARVPLPQRPHPVQFLGQVGQVEVDGERPGHQLGPVQRPAGHQRRDLVPGRIRGRARPSPAPGSLARPLPAAGVDHRVPQPLGVVQQLLAAGLAQHLAQQAAEQPHVAAQRRGQLLPVGVPGRGGSGRGRGILAHPASLVGLCVRACEPATAAAAHPEP